jgi:ribonuclease D
MSRVKPNKRSKDSAPRVHAPYEHITTDEHLQRFCREIASAPVIGFDTEFISEKTYRPELCLVQVNASGKLAIIDPLAVRDLTPFWETIAAPGHQTVVHAGREELIFCLSSIGRRPANLFDLQLAAGLAGYEYPAGYGTLLVKILGQAAQKGETRTDWSARPLTPRQLEYALDDVIYLLPLCDKLTDKLEALHRLPWLATEMESWQSEIEAFRAAKPWWRVAGIAGLPRRSLAIVREIWMWRDETARRRNMPAKHVLRDDLIVELARRKLADPKQMRAIRGMERGDLQRAAPELSQAITRALETPDDQCPEPMRRDDYQQLTLLGQFLAAALSSICRGANLSSSLVGSASDVRELIAFRLGLDGAKKGEPPLLARGWRAEIVGSVIEDLLAGRMAIRIAEPLSDHPLVIENRGK